ncbi:cytochrome P460 family protein [Paenibacillus thalictri]|uniref:Cytochrome P460 domain-containing protein n=1 Tax=Paenibacillus thalictri TaxID=2527873 RepID=A0A4Q9DFW3_9BACL|nr:cytochrome P460 family protein [Paenibacillus thalictri]TBL69089.1 hypothetical protein EYB31_36975 [Paenibacillus thalictri]
MKPSYLLYCAFVVIFLLTGCGKKDNTSEMNDKMSATGQPTQETVEKEGRGLVKLPDNYRNGVIYTTVDRGNAHEKLYASSETLRAVQKGGPIPNGAVFTLEIYRDSVLDDIFVMEKRSDWNDQPKEKQNGDWRFEAYKADQSLNMKRDIGSCISCHASQQRDDFVYTLDRMKSFRLEDVVGVVEDHITPVLKDWEVAAMADYLAGISNVKENS